MHKLIGACSTGPGPDLPRPGTLARSLPDPASAFATIFHAFNSAPDPVRRNAGRAGTDGKPAQDPQACADDETDTESDDATAAASGVTSGATEKVSILGPGWSDSPFRRIPATSYADATGAAPTAERPGPEPILPMPATIREPQPTAPGLARPFRTEAAAPTEAAPPGPVARPAMAEATTPADRNTLSPQNPTWAGVVDLPQATTRQAATGSMLGMFPMADGQAAASERSGGAARDGGAGLGPTHPGSAAPLATAADQRTGPTPGTPSPGTDHPMAVPSRIRTMLQDGDAPQRPLPRAIAEAPRAQATVAAPPGQTIAAGPSAARAPVAPPAKGADLSMAATPARLAGLTGPTVPPPGTVDIMPQPATSGDGARPTAADAASGPSVFAPAGGPERARPDPSGPTRATRATGTISEELTRPPASGPFVDQTDRPAPIPGRPLSGEVPAMPVAGVGPVADPFVRRPVPSGATAGAAMPVAAIPGHGGKPARTPDLAGDVAEHPRAITDPAAAAATALQMAGRLAPTPAPGSELHVLPHGRVPVTIPPIGAQLLAAVERHPDRWVEIRLAPEELGRVRVALSTSDGTVALSLTAERSETLDLIRRHADQLAGEFRRAGFDGLSLSLGQGSWHGPGAGAGGRSVEPSAPPAGPISPDRADAAPVAAVRRTAAGMDIRL